MILISLMLPTKLVNAIQYGDSEKSISLLPGLTNLWSKLSTENVLVMILSKYKFNQVKAAGGEWVT
jgi:hypothetical protein